MRLLSRTFWKAFWIFGFGVSLAVTAAVGLEAMSRDGAGGDEVLNARIGEVVRIGDLELTILAAKPWTNERYTHSSANYQIRYRALNLRTGAAGTYDLAYSDMKLFDSTGAVRDAVPCVQCPGITGDDLVVRLQPGQALEGAFYYKLPSGSEPGWFKYHSLLAKQDAKIALRPAPEVAVVPGR
jgi:hypothetical protein